MNWIEGIQSAIDYIEAHLCEKIDYGKVAGAACSSSYHFQRVFGIMCGITLGEYIRRRRLTLAGKELAEGRKVTEVALKYGYDTPESFSRAFFKFHGMMPSRVKPDSLTSDPQAIVYPVLIAFSNTCISSSIGKLYEVAQRQLSCTSIANSE